MSSAISSFVERTKLRLMVENATSSDDDPTPVYVLDELVQALAAGDTRAGVDAICARLGHRSPVVKQKALKLVTHIGRRGATDLRRLMARQSGAVRELLHFRCAPDPFKGDTVWKRVQEYAQEALNAVHGEGPADAGAGMGGGGGGALRGRIEGFGSSGPGSGGYGSGSYGSSGGGGGSSGRMVGFGSADVLQSGMQALSSGMRSLSSRAQGALLQQDGYSSAQLDGGGYASGGRVVSAPGAGGLSQPIMQAGPAPAPAAGSTAAAASGGSSGGAEQRLVDRICTPGGLRPAPSRDDLRAFVDGLSSLDGPTVAQLLQRKLEAGPWQATLRALCALEAVAESGSSAACGQVAVHFQAHPEAVRRAADSPQASVRQRAAKVLALLGNDSAAAATGAAGAATGPTAAGQQQLYTEDLLGDAEPAGGGQEQAAASSSTGLGGLEDLLGEPAAAGPDVSPDLVAGAAAAVAAAPAAAPADLLAGLELPSAAGAAGAAPAAALGGGGAAAEADLFGGMLLGGQQLASPPGAAASASPAAAAAPAVADLDLLGGLSLGSAPAAPLAASQPAAVAWPPTSAAGQGGLGDLLGGLTLGAGPAPAFSSGGMGAPMQPMQQQAGGGMRSPLGGPALGGPMGAPLQGQRGVAPPAGMQPTAMGGGMQMGGMGGLPAYQQPMHQLGGQGGHMARSAGNGMQVGCLGSMPLSHLGGSPQHQRQPSLGSTGSGPLGSGGLGSSSAALGSIGILDGSKDSTFHFNEGAFNFVGDIIASSKQQQK